MKKILAVIAPGFEELEAVAVIDILRRIGFKVVTAGIDTKRAAGAHDIAIETDATLGELFPGDFDAIYLPGGMAPGAKLLLEDEEVLEAVDTLYKSGKVVAAICAAPIVFAKLGILDGKKFTVYPGLESFLGGNVSTGAAAEADGNVVTGRGPGAVFAFALKFASALGAESECRKVFQDMLLEL